MQSSLRRPNRGRAMSRPAGGPLLAALCLVAMAGLAGCGGGGSAPAAAVKPSANTARPTPGAVVTTYAEVAGPQTPSCSIEQGRNGRFTATAEFPTGDKGTARVVLSGAEAISLGVVRDSTPGTWTDSGDGSDEVSLENPAVRAGGGRLTVKGQSLDLVRCTALRR